MDRQIKHSSDNPTIGLILCKTKNKIMAEYALTNITSPVGLPDALKDQLPGVEELEEGLKDIEDE